MLLTDITSPTLLINKKTAMKNIENMANKAERNNLQFRPHFKTVQSKSAGRLFRKKGVDKITVSSLKMANYFAEDGWDDITIAFPINIREIPAINKLAARIKLNILVVNNEVIQVLHEKIKQPIGVFLKIDVGTNRTGISPDNNIVIEKILNGILVSPHLNFRGFLAHAGHSYSSRSKKEIISVHNSSLEILKKLRKKYEKQYPEHIISTGDTPTCSVAENWKGIDEIRPGNFVFYDLMQVQIGSCELNDIAVALACPVVAKHPDRHEIIVHGGGIHLSKDRMTIDGNNNLDLNLEGKTIFGLPVIFNKNKWLMPKPGNYVKSLSQEHGVISCTPSFFGKINIGDLIGVLPVHSCMTVNLMEKMVSLDGEELD